MGVADAAGIGQLWDVAARPAFCFVVVDFHSAGRWCPATQNRFQTRLLLSSSCFWAEASEFRSTRKLIHEAQLGHECGDSLPLKDIGEKTDVGNEMKRMIDFPVANEKN